MLIGMKIGTGSTAKVLRFSYDASGNVVAVDYSEDGGTNYTTYYYLRNAQNDIVKLIDSTGSTVVEYIYDSWGKIVSAAGSLTFTLGTYQPFRYRGYVYDDDLGLYYLQSRYYDPTICRFISSDVYLSTGQGVLGHNSFAYCLNNPVALTDDVGMAAFANYDNGNHGNDLMMSLDGGSCGGGKRSKRIEDKSKKTQDYVNNQEDPEVRDIPFGDNGNIGDNGCGVVALYNVLISAGFILDFAEFVEEVTKSFGICLSNGNLGTNPVALTNILFRVFGINHVDLAPIKTNGEYSAVIVFYVWEYQGQIGAHYFAAISNGNGIYTAYNDWGINQGSLNDILEDARSQGRIIGFWGVY